MAIKITNEKGKQPGKRPWDQLQCVNCGQEILVPPASKKLICVNCNTVNDKSEFIPVQRTLWVSRRGLPKSNSEKMADFNCVNHYRSVVRLRQSIFRLYESQGYVTETQAIGVFIAFLINTETGVTKLLNSQGKASLGTLNASEDIMRKIVSFLGEIEIKRGIGNPSRSDKLLLAIIAIVLYFCPNSYVHFLRDALRMRSAEIKQPKYTGARAHQIEWARFHTARGGAEASCRRTWKVLFGENPPSVGEMEYPKEEWWLVEARQQGLTKET